MWVRAAEDVQARTFGRAGDALADAGVAPLRARGTLVALLITCLPSRPCQPCGGRVRRYSECPCPCRAPADGACGCWRRPGRPVPCRCPGRCTRGPSTAKVMPSGGAHDHRVRKAERQLQVRALELSAVADALDFERLGEAGGDAGDHVVQQRTREAVQGALLTFVVGAGDRDGAVFAVELRWSGGNCAGEFALGALHR